MSFGDILEQWEAKGGRSLTNSGAAKKGLDGKESKTHPLDIWLNRYGVQDKDLNPESVSRADKIRMQAEERRRLRKMKPEATIDLHGISATDAEPALDAFFSECSRRGLRKILIIHGRGLHSEGQPVLSSIAKSYVERSPLAGEHGAASQEYGGRGAMWVILKKTY